MGGGGEGEATVRVAGYEEAFGEPRRVIASGLMRASARSRRQGMSPTAHATQVDFEAGILLRRFPFLRTGTSTPR